MLRLNVPNTYVILSFLLTCNMFFLNRRTLEKYMYNRQYFSDFHLFYFYIIFPLNCFCKSFFRTKKSNTASLVNKVVFRNMTFT